MGRYKSAPATLQQDPTAGPSHSQSGFQGVSGPTSQVQDTALPAPKAPLLTPTNPILPPSSTPLAIDLLSTCTPPTDKAVTGTPTPTDPEGQAPTGPEIDVGPKEVVNGFLLPHPESLSTSQPMEQEGDAGTKESPLNAPGLHTIGEGGSPKHPHQPMSTAPPLGSCLSGSASDGLLDNEPCSAEMESPTSPQGTVPSERDQPEGERSPSSDNIPSLAAALLELHELLVSNSHAQSQDRSASCSPSHPFRVDADGLDNNPTTRPLQGTLTPENPHPPPSTAITAGAELSDAKANHAAVPAQGPLECLVLGSSGQEENHGRQTTAVAGKGLGQPQCSDSSWERRSDSHGLEDASKGGGSMTEGSSLLQENLELREPPEGQLGRGVADGRASGNDTSDTLGLQPEPGLLSPLSLAVGSPEEASVISSLPSPSNPEARSSAPLFSAPGFSTDQFPSEHIQRIQAAGFSAREAAEALEQAHGSVELALMALLARKITVPT